MKSEESELQEKAIIKVTEDSTIQFNTFLKFKVEKRCDPPTVNPAKDE
jgi:hypothetical protein